MQKSVFRVTVLGTLVVLLVLAPASVRAECAPTGQQSQPEGPNVEAAFIQKFVCNGVEYWIYQYLNRPGARLVRPPDWRGIRNYNTAGEAETAMNQISSNTGSGNADSCTCPPGYTPIMVMGVCSCGPPPAR